MTGRPRRASGSSRPLTRSAPPTTEHAPAAGEPTRTVEIELKFDADADTPLPDWSGLPGVSAVGAAEVRELDARYLDTDDASLARAGYALRRRTGGPDAGWHLKGPRGADGGRVELGWPLGDDDTVPDAARRAIGHVTGDPLHPLARIQNHRTAYALRDADGGLVAEFVDDLVVATDARRGAQSAWREWEFELGPAAPSDPALRATLLAAVEAAVLRAGGRAAASDSKLARALGA